MSNLININNLTKNLEASEKVLSWLYSEWGDMDILHYIRNISQNNLNFSTNLPQVFVASIDGKVVGTISLLDNDMNIRPKLNPWIGCLYVEKRSRKFGIGSKLFKYAENYAKKNGIKKIYLFTSKIQKIAYRHNWSDVEKVLFEEEVVSIMEKDFE